MSALAPKTARSDTAQRAQVRKEHARKVLEEQKIQKARRLWQKHSEYLCTMKFRNTLPDPPLGPSFLRIPFGLERLSEFAPTTLDTTYKWPLHCERDLGVDINIIDPASYLPPASEPEIPPEDLALLNWGSGIASGLSGSGGGGGGGASGEAEPSRNARRRRNIDTDVAWLKKSVYLNNDSLDAGHKFKAQADVQKEREAHARSQLQKMRPANPLAFAQASFAAANGKRPLQHPEKKGVTMEWSVPVLPDLELWSNIYTQVFFAEAPSQDDAIRGQEGTKRRRVERALIRDMAKITTTHGEELHISYLVPPERSADADRVSNGHVTDDLADRSGPYDWVKINKATLETYGAKQHFMLAVDPANQKATFCRLGSRLSARNVPAHERPATAGKSVQLSRRQRRPREVMEARRRLEEELGLQDSLTAAIFPSVEEPDEGAGYSSSGGGGARFARRREQLDADQESVQTEGSNIAVKGTESSEGGDAGSDEDDL